MKADLHMHSTASDGEHEPEELMALCREAGLELAALTDHDSVAGVARAKKAADALGLRLLPGVELSCGAEGKTHVLGLGIDAGDPALAAFFAERRKERERRAERMVEKLCTCGAPISLARVHELAGGVVARPHVARALVEAGHAASVADAFQKYLLPGKPGYVSKRTVPVEEGCALIHGAGGVAVLAHPMQLKMGEAALESVVAEWARSGLDGMECYHPSAQSNHAAALVRMARGIGLLVTGGSDYHGARVSPDRHLGSEIARWRELDADVAALLSRLRAF